jgi:hypothetical protein
MTDQYELERKWQEARMLHFPLVHEKPIKEQQNQHGCLLVHERPNEERKKLVCQAIGLKSTDSGACLPIGP